MRFFHTMQTTTFFGRRCRVRSFFSGWVLFACSNRPFRFILLIEKP